MKVAVAVAALALAVPASASASDATHTARVRAVHEYRHDTGKRPVSSEASCRTQTNWKTWYCVAKARRGNIVGNYTIHVSKRTGKGRLIDAGYIA